MKEHPEYGRVPVYMFSTSTHQRDITVARSLGAADYLPKPYGQKDLQACCEAFAARAGQEPRFKGSSTGHLPLS
jgi:DNA-binding response OmpR family regulator